MKRLIVFSLLFLFMLIYLPTIKCTEDAYAKEKVCELYGECEVDYYYSVFSILINRDRGQFECVSLNKLYLVGIVTFLLLSSIVLAYTGDYLYSKYRDI